MGNREHMLTIVEPTIGGHATLDLAHETVERGGTASVVMVITGRVGGSPPAGGCVGWLRRQGYRW